MKDLLHELDAAVRNEDVLAHGLEENGHEDGLDGRAENDDLEME